MTDNLKIFKGGERFENAQKNLLLNSFVYKLRSKSTNIIELVEKMKSSLCENFRPEGMYIDIFSLKNIGPSFGESINYDAEPHHSLIAGDKAVRHYLKKQRLETITRSVSPVEIPNMF